MCHVTFEAWHSMQVRVYCLTSLLIPSKMNLELPYFAMLGCQGKRGRVTDGGAGNAAALECIAG